MGWHSFSPSRGPACPVAGFRVPGTGLEERGGIILGLGLQSQSGSGIALHLSDQSPRRGHQLGEVVLLFRSGAPSETQAHTTISDCGGTRTVACCGTLAMPWNGGVGPSIDALRQTANARPQAPLEVVCCSISPGPVARSSLSPQSLSNHKGKRTLTDIFWKINGKMSLKVQTSNVTNKNDPKSINSRVFIGNLNTAVVKKSDVETIFSKYGRVLGCSVHKGYAFVQYASERHARGAVIGENGRVLAGQTLDINMAGEPKPNRPKGLKRSAAALYSGYDFDYDYYRDDFYERLFEYRGRVSPVPRVVPVKRPRVAMPLVRRVKSLPVKLLSRSSLIPNSSVKQKSMKTNELQAIKTELTQIKSNIDALLGRLEQITEDKHSVTELRKSEESKSEVSLEDSGSDTEDLVETAEHSEVEDGEEGMQDECDDDMENNHLSEMESILQ
ncbi:hypothetical protein AAFF_G00391850 [Aldrovandia affinis]|uniref:RRM domain-containing protein n=1 Tax=Aldrovandia affinis TaxID=143900 RepID=A0AAD7SE22_9TELE|nr:hypothetical protein AAFF_G00391850 [Aldrovandia affinis]